MTTLSNTEPGSEAERENRRAGTEHQYVFWATGSAGMKKVHELATRENCNHRGTDLWTE